MFEFSHVLTCGKYLTPVTNSPFNLPIFSSASDLGKTAKDTPLVPSISVTEANPPVTEQLPETTSTFKRLQDRMQEIRLVPVSWTDI